MLFDVMLQLLHILLVYIVEVLLLKYENLISHSLSNSTVDPDPVGYATFSRIRIQ